MMNPLGVHFIPTHTGQHHYDYIRAVVPGILKIVGTEFPDVQLVSDGYAAAPQAIHYWRNHALSEQHADLWRDPVGTGKRHAAELVRDAEERYVTARNRGLPMPDRDQVRLLGINEPVVELFPRQEDMSNYGEWLAMMQQRTPLLDSYMETLGLELNARGFGAGLGNFSSGQPANLKPGSYPTFTWFPRTTALLERTRGRNALADHEYWRAETGPEGWWDWHTCRFFHYEVDCDIDILECGVDQWITGVDKTSNRGYQGHITPAEYAAQMGRYIRRCRTDSRFRGATPFTLDGENEWWSFYIEPAVGEFVRLAAELRAETVPAGNDHTVYVPTVGGPTAPAKPPTGTVTGGPQQPAPQGGTWERSRAFVRRWEGGFQDFDWDAGNWTGCKVGVGEKKGTNYGISACSYPHLDIRNITLAQADDIYFRDYWQASGADKLPWPGCLIVFDTAVLHGTGTAQKWLAEVGPNPYLFAAKRLSVYPKLDAWPQAGAAWVRRVAELLQEAAHGA